MLQPRAQTRDLGERHRHVEFLLRGEVVIERRLGQPDRLGKLSRTDSPATVRHEEPPRRLHDQVRRLVSLGEDELCEAAKDLRAPVDLVRFVHENGTLPVVNFAAGGVATPADAALMMQLGAEGVFVGSGIFKSGDPAKRAAAIVKAVANFNDPAVVAAVSEDLGEAMVGINESEINVLMAERGK
jgi:pyridoxal 5'-phosphate synthase subunit Pdx1